MLARLGQPVTLLALFFVWSAGLLPACDPATDWAGPPYVGPPPDSGTPNAALAAAWRAGEIDSAALLERAEALGVEEGPFELSGSLPGHRILFPTHEPHFALADLRVPEGSSLLLMPGAVLELGEGVRLRVKGELYLLGSSEHPATITGRRGAPYASIALGAGPNLLDGCQLRYGTDLVEIDGGGRSDTRIEGCVLDDWDHLAVRFEGADGLIVSRNEIGMATAEADIRGETLNGSRSGALIERNHFGLRRGRGDVIELKKCGDHRPVIRGNVFEGGEDDAIDLDDCSAIVTHNRIRNFRPSPDGGAENGGGITGDRSSAPLIANNIIENSLHGIGFKDGSRPLVVHNTIVDCDVGLTLYTSEPGADLPHGVIVNNLLWGNRDPQTGANRDVVLNGRWWRKYNAVDDVQATFDARGNLGGGGQLPAGEGNRELESRVHREDGLPRLPPGSPTIGAAARALPEHSEFTSEEVAKALATDFLGQPRSFRPDGPGVTPGAIESAGYGQ